MYLGRASIEGIAGSKTNQVISALRENKYSLLASIGCEKMRKEMRIIGLICRFILWFCEIRAKRKGGNYSTNLKKEVGKLLNWGAPSVIRGTFPEVRRGQVFGFNHPTLGEIIRLVAVCVTQYPNKDYLFPVNIAWYEELAPLATRLEMFGVSITPIITPSSRERILKMTGGKHVNLLDKLTRDFNYEYLHLCADFAKGGGIILVAPSATRQATVFKSREQFQGSERIEPQTMTFLASSLKRAKVLDECFFTPIAIVPPENYKRGLNLFRTYKIVPCSCIPPAQVQHFCEKKSEITNQREFEYYFLLRIADTLMDIYKSELAFP